MNKTCSDCRLVFGLVDRHEEFPGTCTGCVARLKGPCKQCDVCDRAIAANEFIWKGDWQLRCADCSRETICEYCYDLRPDDDPEDAVEYAVLNDLHRRLTPPPQSKKDVEFVMQVQEKWQKIRDRRRYGLPVVGD